MSITPQEAEFEQGMEELYKEFKQQYEDEFIYNKIHSFYKDNPNMAKDPIQNFNESKELFSNGYFSASYLHAIIAIEVVIKILALKPILYSLSFDSRASELLYSNTFKQKSIPNIPKLYFEILKDLTGIDLKNIKRKNTKNKLWEEFNILQYLRNDIVHQGISIQKEEVEQAIIIATYIFDEIIPKILNTFHFHLKDNEICYGSLEYLEKMSKIDQKK